jgi:hypothetical protein
MKRTFLERLALLIRTALPALAILSCSCAAPTGAELPKQSRHEFLAVLIDTESKKPVPSARVILAPKKEGKPECTIETSLTGVSNDRGEVRIPNVSPGEYVFFYNLSGSLKPALKGKVVTYGGPHDPRYRSALAQSLCPCIVTKGGSLVMFDGGPSIADGGFESTEEFDIRMITTTEGALLTVRVPAAGGAPVKMEIISGSAK